MAAPIYVTIAVEGDSDEPVLRKVLEVTGRPFVIRACVGKNGKSGLRERIANFNRTAHKLLWAVLIDQDTDPCPPKLVEEWVAYRNPGLQLRVAVRETEAWLLADAERLGRYLSVDPWRIPAEPEEETDPKRALVNLARESSDRAVRADMVPAANSTAVVGPAYVSRITEYALDHWRPAVAARRAPSLRRALARFKRWPEDGLSQKRATAH